MEQESEAIDHNVAANINYKLPAIPLPAAAYMRYEIPETNQAFWDNAFKTVMERDGLSVHDFDALSQDDKASMMIKTNVFLVQYLDYISDTVERNNRHSLYQARLKQGYENFGDPLVSYALCFLVCRNQANARILRLHGREIGKYIHLRVLCSHFTNLFQTAKMIQPVSPKRFRHFNVFPFPKEPH